MRRSVSPATIGVSPVAFKHNRELLSLLQKLLLTVTVQCILQAFEHFSRESYLSGSTLVGFRKPQALPSQGGQMATKKAAKKSAAKKSASVSPLLYKVRWIFDPGPDFYNRAVLERLNRLRDEFT